MDKNNKTFAKGFVFGVISLLVLYSISINLDLIYRKFISKQLTAKQKVSEIESIVNTYYVNDYDENLMRETMYKGMIVSLNDPYSYYMSKDELNRFLEDTNGNYVGIGILVRMSDDKRILVDKVFEDSPAYEEGLKKGDKILKIEDEEVNYNNYTDVLGKIKGEEGTKVKVTVYRESEDKTFDLKITRKSVDVPTVSHRLLDNNIGYISISQFDRVTYEQFKEAYDNLDRADGLIIDLRNNPGGLLTTVNKITDLLVPEGTITYIEDKKGNRDYYKSDASHYGKPLVVLINGNSASASEVLSGAVRDFGVAKLVGETSFGKGVVQNTYRLTDGSGIKITMAKYYTPKGTSIHGIGIKPHYEVKNVEGNERDFQLEKAIDVINSW